MNMKKRILSFLLTVAMVLTLLVALPAVTISADTTVNVGSKAELVAIATAVNDGTDDYAGKTVVLTADLDLSGSNWTSIGTAGNPFRGSFDGNGHTISGMTRSGGAIGGNVGLFGCVSSPDGGSVTIQNFKISGSIVSSNGGENAGTVISMVKPSGTGTTEVNILGVWSTVNFDASTAKMTGVGGILGTISWLTGDYEITVNIDSCRYSGTLDSPSAGSNDYGGIMGYPKEAASPRSVNISNCLFDGILSLYHTAPDDNGGIVGYFKGNGGNSRQTNIHIDDCIVAGQFRHPNKSGVTVTGYVTSEASGSNTDYTVTNVYYCNDADRHTGGDLGGWYGYYKQGEGSISGLITATNVTAKTMTEIKALSSGFSDNSKWHFGTSSELPVPAMIYDNIISNANPYENTSADEYEISSADELMQFAAAVNSGANTFAGKTVLLTADIDLDGYEWQSIGKSRNNGTTTFQGTFDGQGHTIANMTSAVNNADGEGGLFGYVVKSATIRNFKLTGTITATSSGSGNKGYFGTVVGCVFQESATINLSNIWSSVNINATNSGACAYAIGGLVGQVRDASGTFNLNIDSCVYSGMMNFANRADCIGGIIGRTNNNSSGRTLNLNITNTVFAGWIALNDIYSEDVSAIIGYIKGNGSTGAVNVTVSDVLSLGQITFYTADHRQWNPASKCTGGILSSEITGDYAYVTATNLYYKSFSVPTGDGSATTWNNTVFYFNNPSDITVTGGGAMTYSQMAALTVSDFTNGAKWGFKAASGLYYYIPCPAPFADNANWSAEFTKTVGMSVRAEHRNTADAYEGIRFVASFDAPVCCTNGGTQSANFGLILISAPNYDGAADNATIAGLTTADGLQVKAVKYREAGGIITVSVVLYNLTGMEGMEIVAIPYIGETLGTPIRTTYSAVIG